MAKKKLSNILLITLFSVFMLGCSEKENVTEPSGSAEPQLSTGGNCNPPCDDWYFYNPTNCEITLEWIHPCGHSKKTVTIPPNMPGPMPVQRPCLSTDCGDGCPIGLRYAATDMTPAGTNQIWDPAPSASGCCTDWKIKFHYNPGGISYFEFCCEAAGSCPF